MTLVDRATSALVDHRTAVVSAEALAARLGRWATTDATLSASLADGIARLVREGELRGGDRLPSERTLAATVAVSRGTVVSAYARLYEDGILDRRQGSGTRIAGAAPTAARSRAGRGEALYASLSSNIDLLRAVPAIAPRAVEIVHRHRPVLDATTAEADPAGLPALRELIAQTVTDDGTPTTPAQILVTHGGQQALSLLVEELVSPGDTVLTENVSWPGLTDAVRRRGGLVHGIRLTADGIDVAELEAAIVVRRPVLIALNPHNHNPTGIQTHPLVRQRIADLAAEHGITVVEDRVLAHLSFDGVTPPLARGPAAGRADHRRRVAVEVGLGGSAGGVGARRSSTREALTGPPPDDGSVDERARPTARARSARRGARTATGCRRDAPRGRPARRRPPDVAPARVGVATPARWPLHLGPDTGGLGRGVRAARCGFRRLGRRVGRVLVRHRHRRSDSCADHLAPAR